MGSIMSLVTDERFFALLAHLQQLLEEERQVLLSGMAEDISDVVERKLALADLLDAADPAPVAIAENAGLLAQLERYNRENSVIVSALLRHMTQALDELRRHDAHRSYQPDGTERSHPPSQTLGAA